MPPTPVPAPGGDFAGRLTEHLYCMACGYDLYGLEAHPTRCTECGHINPTGPNDPIPERFVEKELHWLEAPLTRALWCAMLSTAIVAGSVTWFVRDPKTPLAWSTVAAVFHPMRYCNHGALIIAGAALLPWLVLLVSAHTSAGRQRGWRRVALGYHALAVCASAAIAALVAYLYEALDKGWDSSLDHAASSRSSVAFVALLLIMFAAALLTAPLGRAHRRLLQPLAEKRARQAVNCRLRERGRR